MSLRPAEPCPAAALRPTRSLAAVLAAGQQRQEAGTALSLFGKPDYKKKFREALMEVEDRPKKEADVKKAAAKLTKEQIEELETEFKTYEERGWKEMADNTAWEKKMGQDRDSWKGYVARLVAQRKVLRAHYALVLLHTLAPDGDDIVELPMRPDDMGAMYHALTRWATLDFTRGTTMRWTKIRDVRDHLDQVNDVLRRKRRERGAM